MGVASLILGICGFLFSCVPCLSQILSLLGFIFGIIGTVRKTSENDSKGCAIAGLILSSIAMITSIFVSIV